MVDASDELRVLFSESSPSVEGSRINVPGVYYGQGVNIDKSAKIGPNAVILGHDENGNQAAVIEEEAEIGANATILSGVTVGVRARVAPGSVVTRSVPPLAIVEGNPAKIIGYVETYSSEDPTININQVDSIPLGFRQTRVRDVTVHHFNKVPDLRGSLSVGEFEREIPFVPKRYFLVYDVPTAEVRGEHAHFQCGQFLIAVKGSVSVVVDDGDLRDEILLDRPQMGVYLPPMTWGVQYNYSTDAVLLVFASEFYDSDDYIRDYSKFLELVKRAA
ncbi:TDP-4-oxo-6-deoxy-alpha-D-glucose-3,4-oxoisomerase [Gimesia alba]|uniref:TDP-4-oxo-6-deoxy-alpha-D-glucose-3, 4-oxoisomerase n=1 Tax=Gimesia alba TaxID=2527973 RepID=A0A517RGQ8_9PLAN|nr:WxcM-like domain-containing protein [Gimesia alba]QDT43056.1 TDP-4-oxo-6-deoxy-alpha-D-glucose-3,4-oxoisomerase [Gimesia alba]